MKTNVELISTRVYAGRLKDRENLNNSSSGGAFTALSDFFLKNLNIGMMKDMIKLFEMESMPMGGMIHAAM